MLSPCWGAAEEKQDKVKMKVKVRKERVVISPVDGMGTVTVEGLIGAIDTTGPTKLVVERLVTTPTEVNEDGSFLAKIQAQPGDKIVVRARNRQGRTSRGTFTVPEGMEVTKEKPEGEETTEEEKPRRLEVVIQIVDMDTGEPVVQKRFEWTSKIEGLKEALRTAQNMANAGVQAAKKELARVEKLKILKRKAEKQKKAKPEQSENESNPEKTDPNNIEGEG